MNTYRLALSVILLVTCALIGATTAQTPTQPPGNARFKISSQATLQNLRALSWNAPIETRKGTVVSAQRFLAVADAIRAPHSKSRAASPNGFSRTQATPALVMQPGTHLPSLLARPDGDVLQLPNGTKLTVGDMKKLSQIAPQMRGQPLLTSGRADLQGSAVRITSGKDLVNLRNSPDNTIVENAKGVRITLGELRAEARKQRR